MVNISNSMSTAPAQSKPLSSPTWTVTVASLTGVSATTCTPTKNNLKKKKSDGITFLH